jgi:hypothetical protein
MSPASLEDVKTKGQGYMDLIYLDLKKMVGGWKRWSETTQEEKAKDQLTAAWLQ